MSQNIYPLCANSYLLAEAIMRDNRWNALAFDIGANEGGMTEWLARFCARVVAFEPVPNMHQKALARLASNPRVEAVRRLGLSDAPASIKVNVYNTWTLLPDAAARRDRAIEYKGTPDFDVELVTLDAMAEEYGAPSFIKLDVDGYEEKVIRGGMKTLTERRPVVFMELSFLSKLLGAADYTLPLRLMYELGYEAISNDGALRCRTFDEAMPYFPHHTSYDVTMVHTSEVDAVLALPR